MTKEQYRIHMFGMVIAVTEETYKEYFRIERHLKTLEEKDHRYGLFFYNEYDTDDGLGEEFIYDPNSPSVEDLVIGKLMQRELRHCLSLLPEEDQKLIHALYYEQVTEEELGKRIGITQSSVSKWKARIIQKLQIFIK